MGRTITAEQRRRINANGRKAMGVCIDIAREVNMNTERGYEFVMVPRAIVERAIEIYHNTTQHDKNQIGLFVDKVG